MTAFLSYRAACAVDIGASSHQAFEFSQRAFREDKTILVFVSLHDAFGKRDIGSKKPSDVFADYLSAVSVCVTLTQSPQPDTLLHLLSIIRSKLFGWVACA